MELFRVSNKKLKVIRSTHDGSLNSEHILCLEYVSRKCIKQTNINNNNCKQW